jgi:hypothetical protein
MASRQWALALVVLAVSVTDGCGAESLRLDRVEARLYYSHSGTFSEALTPAFALWNVIIGEGNAKEPSSSTLIDAIVKGRAGSFDPTWSVEFVAKDTRTGRVIARRTAKVGVLGNNGISHIPFWLSDTGCEPLTVAVTIHGDTRSIDIPFRCGE